MTLERTYIIPLRKDWLKAPKYKRVKRAVSSLRTFLSRHMKSEDVRLGVNLNLELWKHGIKNPPSRVKVNVLKDDKGVVRAELFGFAIQQEKTAQDKKSVVSKLKEKVTKAATEATEELSGDKKEAPKEVPKPAESKAAPKKAAAPKTEKPAAAKKADSTK